MTDTERELVKKPLDEWFYSYASSVLGTRDYVCEDGKTRLLRDYATAAEAWDGCENFSWLLKALTTLRIFNDAELKKILFKVVDSIPMFHINQLSVCTTLPPALDACVKMMRNYANGMVTYDEVLAYDYKPIDSNSEKYVFLNGTYYHLGHLFCYLYKDLLKVKVDHFHSRLADVGGIRQAAEKLKEIVGNPFK